MAAEPLCICGLLSMLPVKGPALISPQRTGAVRLRTLQDHILTT